MLTRARDLVYITKNTILFSFYTLLLAEICSVLNSFILFVIIHKNSQHTESFDNRVLILKIIDIMVWKYYKIISETFFFSTLKEEH